LVLTLDNASNAEAEDGVDTPSSASFSTSLGKASNVAMKKGDKDIYSSCFW
jgi:hypothetical protein